MKLPDTMTDEQLYAPAMVITNPSEAREYFEALVDRNYRLSKNTLEQAEAIERSNLGYFAGYYSHETRERVERLFQCEHPVFGAIAVKGAPTFEQAFLAGVMRGLGFSEWKP
jgi:hypothetical protein